MEYSQQDQVEQGFLKEYLKAKARRKAKAIEPPAPPEEEQDRQYPGFQDRFLKYEFDPVGFIENELGELVTDDIKKLLESVRDYTITQGKSANGVGKTHGIARLAIWWYLCKRGAQIYTAAAPPESNLRDLLWSQIGAITERNPHLFPGHKMSTMRIQRNSSEFITGVLIPTTGTREQRLARFSGKHAPNLLFILDEGDAIPPEIYDAIESCMSGGHARLCVTFNPRSPQGPLYNMEMNGMANIVQISAFTNPNVVTGENIIPGAVTREKTVDRISRWSRPIYDGESPDEPGVFMVPEYLVGCRAWSETAKAYMEPIKAGLRKATEPAIHHMVLAEYPPGGANQLVPEHAIQSARSRWEAYVSVNGVAPPVGVRPLLGHDVASEGDDWNCICLRYGGYIPPMKKWRGVDARASGDRGAGIASTANAEMSFIDATGVGAGSYGAYRVKGLHYTPVYSMGKPTRRTDFGQFYRLRDQVLWSMREWLLNDPSATLPPSEILLEEIRVLTYELSAVDGKIHVIDAASLKASLGRSPDELMSLAYTFAPPRKKRTAGGSIIVKRI